MTDQQNDTEEPETEDEPKTPEQLELENAQLRQQLENAEATIAELKANEDRLRRSMAFYDNRKRQVERELDELRTYGAEGLAKRILPVRDSLTRALEAASGDEASLDAIREGVEMVVKQFDAACEGESITVIEAVGEAFDPNVHEAVAQVPTEDAEPNVIIDEYQRGYRLKERLLRPAMVIIAAPGTDDSSDTNSEA